MQTIGSDALTDVWHPTPRYDRWLDTLEIPIHRAYFIEDLRELALSPWEERECNAAVVVLDEDPWIRETFEKELAKRGVKSLMPDEAYLDRDFQWPQAKDGAVGHS